MTVDRDRVQWNGAALRDAGLDALVCSLPENVLLSSGYWPVVGTAISIAAADGSVAVLAPEDESRFASAGWADPVATFRPSSLDRLTSAAEQAREPLRALLERLGLQRARLGCDFAESPVLSSYSSTHLYGSALPSMLREIVPGARVTSASDTLSALRSRLTAREIGLVRRATEIAGEAFRACADFIRPGIRERDVDGFLRAALASARGLEETSRAHGFAWCMSGPNSARASAAFAHSTSRTLRPGDLVLVHCNSYLDGFWTDITRTFFLGRPDAQVTRFYQAVARGRQAALALIRPGVQASAVDAAARQALRNAGFADHFPHSTGHGVGFLAIDANARPRLHPASPDVLQEGMVCNVEPAIYCEGFGGVRECEMVAITASGYELLTSFLEMPRELLVA